MKKLKNLVITQLDLRNRRAKNYAIRINLTQRISWGEACKGIELGRSIHGLCVNCETGVNGDPHVICERCGRLFCAECAETSLHECPYCGHTGSPA